MQYQSRFRGCLDPVTGIGTIDIALDYNYMPFITNKRMQISYEEEGREYVAPRYELFKDTYDDFHDLYYRRALENAFLNQEPPKIEAVFKGIKAFRKEIQELPILLKKP